MSESEKRYKQSLAKLEKAVASVRASNGKEKEALLAQNAVLQEGLDNLKADYEKLEGAFADLKEQIKIVQAESEVATSQTGANDAEAAQLRAERDSLQEQLNMTQADYQTLEDSFTALKSQYAAFQDEEADYMEAIASSGAGVVSEKEAEALREERDSLREELEKIKSEYVSQLAENELLQAEAAGVGDAKERLKETLDGTISRLEEMERQAS